MYTTYNKNNREGLIVSQEDRLDRIEGKVDKISDSVNSLVTATTVISHKCDELEMRRQESHARANKFSEKMDHMHDGIHNLDAHVKGLESRVGITTKILMGLGSILIAAIINELITHL